MSGAAEETFWVTPKALERLRAELAELALAVSPESEKGQGSDLRIRELERLLKHAELGEKPDDGLVEPGMQITVRFVGGDPETFLLGSRELMNADGETGLDVYSPTSPLGVAIIGKHTGDTASYLAPTGATVHVEITEVVPFRG
ncbi:hypothetical protein GY21_01795 [Cryobacterium roopkundense]|uniref:Transcription elongation factor GreA n=1 Tax=Cryobacterium roopkundense TaxID=1001240 RepID=A0A099JUR7_9MICO|nr:GreA/GreB family elongation factor [Cryobacterium roopkundense]KGJ81123.1 hypothetical protein GY21_01795 [Cryobacterium roopkundense]MBB5641883.1 transcription elongation factor GreA [Cryobacterium roopkundense]